MTMKYWMKLSAVITHVVISCTVLMMQPSVGGDVPAERTCRFRVGGGGSIGGKCIHLFKCPAAISDLNAGVPYQPCRTGLKQGIVCCPTEERISEKKCLEYQNVLKGGPSIDALLPIDLTDPGKLEEVKCPESNLGAFIYGGENAGVGEFPHMVALGYEPDHNSKVQWLCGGTLISPNFVLTAAHCLESAKTGPVKKVMLGILKLSDESDALSGKQGIIVDVEERISHPDHRESLYYNDIALLKLKSNVKISKSLRPACLPQPKNRFEKITLVQVTGWGLNSSDVQSDILQKVTVKRYPQNECEMFYRHDLRLPKGILSSEFCAGDPKHGKDSCNGDSGGPLTVTVGSVTCVYYVTGAVSFGYNILCGEQPGVYTNVQSYLNWIEEIVWPERT